MAVAPVTVTGLVFGAGKAGRHLQTRGRCRVGRRGCRRARIRRQALRQAEARGAGVAAVLHMMERTASRRARVNGSSRAVTGSPLTSRIPPRARTGMRAPPAPAGAAARRRYAAPLGRPRILLART